LNLLALLVFSYSLTLGANSGAFNNYTTDPYTYQAITLPLFVDLQAELALGPVFVGAGIRDDFTPIAWNEYDPLQNTYTVRAGLRFTLGDGMTLEAGWMHNCYHPEAAYSTVALLTGETIAVPRYEGALDSGYVTLRGRVDGVK
jgi:hypothetical protein